MINKSRSILLRMRYISDKICTGNRDIRFIFNNFFFPENRAVYGKKKYCTTRDDTHDNVTDPHYMLDN